LPDRQVTAVHPQAGPFREKGDDAKLILRLQTAFAQHSEGFMNDPQRGPPASIEPELSSSKYDV